MAKLVQETKTPFAHALEVAAPHLPGSATWLEAVRRQAFQHHLDLGLPTKSDEAWRYTTLEPVRKGTFAPSVEPDLCGVGTGDLGPFSFDGERLRAVFVNGLFAPELSSLDDLPDGLQVRSLRAVLEDDADAVEPHLTKLADFRHETFAGLNTALFADGALVEVADGAVIDEPVHLVFVSADADAPLLSSPRVLVRLGTSSELQLVETHAGLGEAASLTNAVAEVFLGNNATLDHVTLQRQGPEALQVTTGHVEAQRDATYNGFQMDLGARLVRNMLTARLLGEGCHAAVNGLFMPEGTQHVDNYTQLDHVAPHCTSHELYKGILDDEATAVFRGRIYVEKGAQKTDAIQHNPNLLLSDAALVNSLPQLEIYADDVKCTHGSTIGQLEEEQLFYCQSRGIDRATAKSILTYAFARDVFMDVRPKGVRQTLSDLVLERLPNGRAVQEALE